MSEEKLDLILTVVSELKGSVGRIELRMDNLEVEFKDLKTEFKDLKTEVKDLKAEVKDFKKQVIQALKSLNSRIDTLEKQIFAIGVELKDEIRREIREVRDDIEFLEEKLMIEQKENIKYNLKVKKLEERVTKIEEKVKLAA